MSRAFIISILLHTFVVAILYIFLNQQSPSSTKSEKRISINNITIKKEKQAKQTSKSQKPKAKSNLAKELKVQKKTPKKKKVKSKKLKAKKKRVKNLKLKNKIKKQKTHKTKVTQKTKAHLKKQKVKKQQIKARKKRITKHTTKKGLKKHRTNKLITTHHNLPTTNIKAKIYQAINRAKNYPRVAKRLGLEGVVVTCFTVYPNRDISNITTSNSHKILQKSAIDTIYRARGYFPNIPRKLHLCVDIKYLLD